MYPLIPDDRGLSVSLGVWISPHFFPSCVCTQAWGAPSVLHKAGGQKAEACVGGPWQHKLSLAGARAAPHSCPESGHGPRGQGIAPVGSATKTQSLLGRNLWE